MWSARSALFRLHVWCTRSGVFVFFTKEEGEGEVQKRSLNPFPENKKKKRRESESETFVVDFVCLFFLGLSTSSKDTNRMATFLYYSFVGTNTLLLLLIFTQ